MKLLNLLLSIFIIFTGCNKIDPEKYKKDGDRLTGSFQKNLQLELTSAITDGGAINAIEKCADISPDSEKKSSNKDFTIKRISARFRNPNHKPDSLESDQLSKWEEETKSGKEILPVVFETEKEIRYMKPIKIQNALCLSCHGSKEQIDSAVLKKIREKYPEDLAVDYKENELRGAFSLTWKK